MRKTKITIHWCGNCEGKGITYCYNSKAFVCYKCEAVYPTKVDVVVHGGHILNSPGASEIYAEAEKIKKQMVMQNG